MFIKSIHLKNFKRFKELDLEFPGDITVVKGPNEQGKSTIVEGLIAALFYDPQKSNKKLESLKSWNSDRMYSIACTFEHNGEAYELSKDFAAKKVSLINKNTGELWNDAKEVANILFRFGGYRNEKLFTSTALVKQDSLSEIASGKKELSQALEDLMSSGAEGGSVADIIKRIDARLEEMTRGLERPSKTPGLIKEFQERQKEKEEAHKRLRDELASIHIKTKIFKEKENELQKIAKNLELKKAQLEDMKNYFNLERHKNEVRERIEEFARDIELLERLEKEHKAILQELKAHPAIRDQDLKLIYNLSKEVELHSSYLQELEHNPSGSKAHSAQGGPLLSPLQVAGTLTLAFMGIGGFFISPWFFAAWILGGGILVWMTLSSIVLPKQSTAQIKRESLRENKKLTALKRSLTSLFRRLGVSDQQEAEERIQHVKNLSAQREQLASKKEGVLRGKKLDTIRKDKRDIEHMLAVEEAKIPEELLARPPAAEDKKQLEKITEDLEKQQRILTEEYSVLRGELGSFKGSSDSLITLEEELADIETSLERLGRKADVYQYLKESLQEAKNRAVRGVKTKLEEFMKDFASEITGGRYSDIQLTDELILKVLSPEKKEFVIPDEALSRGTIDQLYLVARFAFLEIITGKGKVAPKDEIIQGRPLIILDDPFHSFDSSRKSRAKEILKRLSHEFQIILLTHSDEYDTWGAVTTI